MKKPVQTVKPVISSRIIFMLLFTLFYWGVIFIYKKTSLQLSQVIFDLAAGVFAGAVTHVAMSKVFGPLLFGRGFCGWVCWNASVFEMLPTRKRKSYVSEKYYVLRYVVLVVLLVVPFLLLAAGFGFQGHGAQFKWLLIENGIVYVIGIGMTFVLGDKRAFCKYLCPSAALMTITSQASLLKVEKNHLKCNKCGICEQVCPMDVPILSYIATNQRVSHPECILCTECVKHCPRNCLTVGIGRKTETTPELGKSY